MKSWQDYVRDAAIGAVDDIADRIVDSSASAEKAVHRLAKEWAKLTAEEKEQFAEIVVAITGAAMVAISALRQRGKKKKVKARKAAKKAGKEVLKKLAVAAVQPKKKAKKLKKK